MSMTKHSIAVAILSILSGIGISAIAAYYSISGLMLIFSGAAFSIMIMGIALEIGKIVASVWLKTNWKVPAFLIKVYLLIAVAILMFITSMGIFGFLSKSYSNQKLMVNQSQQELMFYDQQISVKNFELESQLSRIETSKTQLSQLDEFITQSLSRTSEQTTDSAVSRTARLRQSQSSERRTLNNNITEAENSILEIRRQISAIELEKLPYTQNVETVKSELGPLIYISQLIYKDNSEAQLDQAVGWIILLLVLVFDPLALILLLSGLHILQKLGHSGDEPVPSVKVVPDPPDNPSDNPPDNPSDNPSDNPPNNPSNNPPNNPSNDSPKEPPSGPTSNTPPAPNMFVRPVDQFSVDQISSLKVPTDNSNKKSNEELSGIPIFSDYIDGPVVQPDGDNAWYIDGKKYQTDKMFEETKSLYTQNEEQAVSGVWSNLKNLISKVEYDTISEQKSQSTLERLKGT